MNTLTRLVAGCITAAVAVLLLFFLTTVGLVLAAVLGIALFVGALSMRGKGRETQVGGFRVVTFGSMPKGGDRPSFERQAFDGQSFEEQGGKPSVARQQTLDNVVDLSPEDYKPVGETSNDMKKPE